MRQPSLDQNRRESFLFKQETSLHGRHPSKIPRMARNQKRVGGILLIAGSCNLPIHVILL